MGGPDATPNLWKQLFSAVRASGGYPGNVATILKPEFMLISLFSYPTVPNVKALAWKMAAGITKMWKSITGSVYAYLMSSKAHYQHHELGTLDE